MGKEKAVVVRQFNKDNPAEALDVVKRDVPEPKAGLSYGRNFRSCRVCFITPHMHG